MLLGLAWYGEYIDVRVEPRKLEDALGMALRADQDGQASIERGGLAEGEQQCKARAIDKSDSSQVDPELSFRILVDNFHDDGANGRNSVQIEVFAKDDCCRLVVRAYFSDGGIVHDG